ncbi:hypothetical protein FOL47_001279 [Perkinsus chesapeaki]|uniref:Uncharacterized protein n=1 Tax=Perkinsus chesapeaki TaxID=330153 RepID=A0A7J6N1G4_PERCH|nr:hypothetical protein FOL47_001279 [Perkinsus chesapeaki]
MDSDSDSESTTSSSGSDDDDDDDSSSNGSSYSETDLGKLDEDEDLHNADNYASSDNIIYRMAATQSLNLMSYQLLRANYWARHELYRLTWAMLRQNRRQSLLPFDDFMGGATHAYRFIHDQILQSGLDPRGMYWTQSSEALKEVLSSQLFQNLADAAQTSKTEFIMDQHSELKQIDAYMYGLNLPDRFPRRLKSDHQPDEDSDIMLREDAVDSSRPTDVTLTVGVKYIILHNSQLGLKRRVDTMVFRAPWNDRDGVGDWTVVEIC